MGLGFTKNQVHDGDLSPYMNHDVLEAKFYDFRGSADENDRILNRKNKVHDGPR